MPIWRIKSIPELKHLTPKERNKVLKPTLNWFVRTKLAVVPLAGGIMPITSGSVLIYNDIYPIIGVLIILFGVVAALYIYTYMISRCQAGLRSYLAEVEIQGVYIACLGCSYDLRGSDTGICP